jgi:hypothetical protein
MSIDASNDVLLPGESNREFALAARTGCLNATESVRKRVTDLAVALLRVQVRP